MSFRYPSYSDLDKDCRDLFNKGYHFGLFKINVKNVTCHGMEILTSGTHKSEDKSAVGDVEIKNTYPFKGLASSHKWNTDNQLNNEISLQDLIPGGKVALGFRINPDTGISGGSLKTQYKHPKVTFDAAVDAADDSNLITGASIVGGHKGLIGGYKLDYDTAEGALKANNFALGYQCRDYGLLLTLDNLSIVHGHYYHRISREVEVGAHAKVGEEGGPQFDIGGKYKFSGYGHALKAKVNNQSMLGLGLELAIVPGFQAFASGNIDLKNFSAGNHQIGFGLEFGYN